MTNLNKKNKKVKISLDKLFWYDFADIYLF